ncbi:GNAT family N-acetyltransferase [Microbispora sp. NEAU-D428]|uniref:GNAT family N-acetyltransferase n=1 Tax=Microbispora sitophila TaxID=2771537 RepID=UPI0018672462|nr:GNAT family N-acetyltransferase [Microbispora sitophila]MBE3012777.1 GNAT family N-acetyltransferase [Microbispora sitophila]
MNPVVIRRLGGEDWPTWRRLRLAALADAPGVFHGDLDEERAYDEARWRAWTEDGVKVAAFDADMPVGVAAGRVPADRAGAVELFGMWVRPEVRGGRIAERLALEVVAWARETERSRVELWVVSGNESAERVYRRLGFHDTGEYELHPFDPGLRKYVMAKGVGER